MSHRFTKELKAMQESGLPLEKCLSQLRSMGASILECIVAVKEVSGCELSGAKKLVHTSKAWHDVAEATDKMWDDLIHEIEKDKP